MTDDSSARSDAPAATDDGSPHGPLIDCRAPRHACGSRRLLVTPGAVSVGYGAGDHAVLLLRLGRADGSVETLLRGRSLYGLADVATGSVDDHRPDAVWITDRSYLLAHWSPWLVRTVESRLAAAAARVDAPLVAWTGEGRDPSPAPTGMDGVAAGSTAGGTVGVERPAGAGPFDAQPE